MPDAPAARVVVLDDGLIRQALAQVSRLDAAARLELGPAYSHVDWSEEAFLSARPGKWELSHGAFIGSDLAGFWIASRVGQDAHTHRVAIRRDARGGGVGRALFEAVRAAAERLRCRRLTLTVASPNAGARTFYERLGFVRLQGDGLARFAGERGRRCDAAGDEIVEDEEGHVHRYVAYVHELGG